MSRVNSEYSRPMRTPATEDDVAIDSRRQMRGLTLNVRGASIGPMAEESLCSSPVPGDGVGSIVSTYTPRRRTGLLELDFGDGMILYDSESSMVHHLNPSAAIVWQLCKGSSSVDDLVRDIADEFDRPPVEVMADVGRLVREFEERGLTEDPSGELWLDRGYARVDDDAATGGARVR